MDRPESVHAAPVDQVLDGARASYCSNDFAHLSDPDPGEVLESFLAQSYPPVRLRTRGVNTIEKLCQVSGTCRINDRHESEARMPAP